MPKLTKSLRTEIQTLVLWWIPAAVVTALATGFAAVYLQRLFEDILSGESTLGTGIAHLTVLNWIARAAIGNMDNLVIAVWQYRVAAHPGTRPSLIWFFFGLFAGLFSVIAYIGIRIYETNRQRGDAAEPCAGDEPRSHIHRSLP